MSRTLLFPAAEEAVLAGAFLTEYFFRPKNALAMTFFSDPGVPATRERKLERLLIVRERPAATASFLELMVLFTESRLLELAVMLASLMDVLVVSRSGVLSWVLSCCKIKSRSRIKLWFLKSGKERELVQGAT